MNQLDLTTIATGLGILVVISGFGIAMIKIGFILSGILAEQKDCRDNMEIVHRHLGLGKYAQIDSEEESPRSKYDIPSDVIKQKVDRLIEERMRVFPPDKKGSA